MVKKLENEVADFRLFYGNKTANMEKKIGMLEADNRERDSIVAAGIHAGMDIKPGIDTAVDRARDINGKDMGEWWIQNTRGLGVWRVTDEDMKAYNRDRALRELGI